MKKKAKAKMTLGKKGGESAKGTIPCSQTFPDYESLFNNVTSEGKGLDGSIGAIDRDIGNSDY